MILRGNGGFCKSAGRFMQVNAAGDIILTFDVIGSYFPARQVGTNGSQFYFEGQNGVENKVYIDFNDGTGEHVYDFKASGGLRRLTWETNPNPVTPQTVSIAGVFNVPVYYYQDLPAGVKNTVNDSYMMNGQTRSIKVRFQRPEAVVRVQIIRILLYNQLPGAFSKLANIESLNITSSINITSFPQDFYNSRIKTLTLQNVGNIMNSGFPFWVLNSPLINLALPDSINLSGSAVVKKFNLINSLKNTLVTLNLSGTNIDYPLPQEFGELNLVSSLVLSNNLSEAFRFCPNITGLTSLQVLDLNRTKMPWAEYERILQGIPTLRTVTIPNLSFITDQDFQQVNNNITTIQIGGTTWNNGAVPSFVNKLKALKILILRQLSGNLSTSFNSFGNFAGCTELTTLDFSRVTTIPATVPAWFTSLTKLKTVLAPAAFTTLARVNDFVNNWYAFVTANAQMVGTSAHAFRTMNFDLYGSTTNDTVNSVRPTGTYQQPAGYVLGSSNGTPASPMEKIWVLEKQYGHFWNPKPL